MAYTKTNLNETTETVAVDMAAEDIENNETTETVVKQNARAYSKTVWNESTPITADKLNKIENGIASALPLSGGALTGSITVPGESKFYNDAYTDPWSGVICSIKASGHVGIGGSLKVNDRLAVLNMIESPTLVASTDLIVDRYGFKSFYTSNQDGAVIFCNKNNSSITLADNRMIYRNPHGNVEIGPQNAHNCHFYTDRPSFYFNRDLYVNGSRVYHEGNKPTPAAIGALPLTGGTLTNSIEVQGESKFYNDAYTDPWHGELCSIKASGHVGIGGSLKINGKLAFSNFGTGGGLNANIHSLALQERIGNGQMITAASDNRIYVGNPLTPLMLESNINPIVNVSGNQYHIYHTGNRPTAWDIGAMTANNPSFEGNMIQYGPNGRSWIYHINADMGSLHMAPHSNGNNDWDRQIMFDRDGQIFCNGRKKVPTWDGNPTHYMFRYGSGLGGANGYITFSY